MTTDRSSESARQGDALGLREAWQLVVRHRLLFVAVLLGTLALGAGYTLIEQPVYEATASLRVSDEAQTLPTPLAALTGVSAQGEVPTEMEVLESRVLAEQVVEAARLRVALRPTVPVIGAVPPRSVLGQVEVADDAPSGPYLLVGRGGGRFAVQDSVGAHVGDLRVGRRGTFRGVSLTLAPAAAAYDRLAIGVVGEDAAITTMQLALRVTRPDEDAKIIQLRYRSTDPALARDVLNGLTGAYIERHQQAVRTGARSTALFLRGQIDTLSRQLAEAEEAVRRYRERQDIVNIEQQSGAEVSGAADMLAQRSQLATERDALDKLLAEVRAEASAADTSAPSPYRQVLAFPSLLRNPIASQLLGSLTSLENERSTLLSRHTAADPAAQSLSERIVEIEGQARQIATTYLSGLDKQVAAMDAVLARREATMHAIPAKELNYARLARRAKLREDMFTALQTRLQEAEIAQAVEDPSIQVIDPAVAPQRPVQPNRQLDLAIAGALGLLLAFGACFAREGLDRTIRDRHELRAITGLPVLASIPRLADARILARRAPAASALPRLAARLGGAGAADARAQVLEAYRTLRTNLAFALADDARIILVTSPVARDGKSTSALNTAFTFAQLGCRVALVDADMRRGKLNMVLGAPVAPGLADVLAGRAEASDARVRIEIEGGGAIDFIPAGTLVSNPSELLYSPRMRVVVERLRSAYDIVLLDAPPVNLVSDAAILSKVADAVVVVARAGQTTSEQLRYAVEQLESVRAPVVGCVLNGAELEADSYYYDATYAPALAPTPPVVARFPDAAPVATEETRT